MADFYSVYNTILSAIESGEIRQDQLDHNEELVYMLGSGKATIDDLSDQGRAYVDTYLEGGPSFKGMVKSEATEGIKQAGQGVTQIPGIAEIAGQGYNYQDSPGGAAMGAVKGAFNVPMGLLRAQGAPATAAADTIIRNTGLPNNMLTRVPLEVGAGLVQDAATVKGLTTLGIMGRRAPQVLRRAKELINAPASGIEYVPPQGAMRIDELASTGGAVHTPSLQERFLGLIKPQKEKTMHNQVLRDLVEESIAKDKKVMPLDLKDVIQYARSPEFKAFSQEATDVLRKEGFSDAAIAAFLRSRAGFLVHPGNALTAEQYARSQVVQEIGDYASKNPELSEKLGFVYKPKEPLGPDPQPSLFGRDVEATPASIERKGPVAGTPYEIERLLPGQLEGKGIQGNLPYSPRELVQHPVLTEAERDAKLLKTYNDVMSGRDIDAIPMAKDPSFVMKMHNLMRKSIYGLVTGPGTGFRNAAQQAIKSGLEIPVSAYQEILNGGSLTDAIRNVGAQLGATYDLRGSSDLVEMLTDAQKQRLAYRGMYDMGELKNLPSFKFADKVIDPLFNAANLVNATQEKYFWLRGFKAHLDGWAAKAGIAELKPGEVPQNVLDDAFKFANELTYSRDLPKAVKEGWDKALSIPGIGLLLQEAQPFARFNWGNALMDVLDFGPTGMYHAMVAGDADEAGRILGKALVGNKLLSEAMRQRAEPKGEWYEVQIPGMGLVDARKWHPLDTYFLLAELSHRPLGSPNARVTNADVAQILAGGNRLDDTVVGAVVGMYQGSGTQELERDLGRIAGTWLARWTTPLKWLQAGQQIIAGDPASMVQRDVNSNQFGLGGMLDRPASNVPGLAERLPARIDPTTPEPPGVEGRSGAARKLFGLDAVKTNRLKEELKRLKFTGPQGKDFGEHLGEQLDIEDQRFKTGELDVPRAGDFLLKLYARTGDPKLNRILNENMAQQGSKLLESIMDTPAYASLTDAQRGLVMSEVITGLKASFKQSQKAGASPHQAIDAWMKNQSPSLRRLLDELARQRSSPYLK